MNLVKTFVKLVEEHEGVEKRAIDYLEDMRGLGHGDQESRIAIEEAIATSKVTFDEKRRRVGRADPDR